MSNYFLKFLPVKSFLGKDLKAFSQGFLDNQSLKTCLYENPATLEDVVKFLKSIDPNCEYDALKNFLTLIDENLSFNEENVVNLYLDDFEALKILLKNNFKHTSDGYHFLFAFFQPSSKVILQAELFNGFCRDKVIDYNDLISQNEQKETVLDILSKRHNMQNFFHRLSMYHIKWIEPTNNRFDHLLYYLGKIDKVNFVYTLKEQYPLGLLIYQHFNGRKQDIEDWMIKNIIHHDVYNYLKEDIKPFLQSSTLKENLEPVPWTKKNKL